MSTSAERMRRLRERRAAGLAPAAGDRVLRSADELLLPSVKSSVAALGDLGDADQATATLAERYAGLIDDAADEGWALRWIGPLLLAALKELGATPGSRKAVAPPRRGPSRLDELRQAAADGRPFRP